MNCQQFIERLDEYLDGELTHPDHPSAISHAQSCSSCQWRLTQRQALRAALRELPVPSARPGFLDDALHQARRSYPRWRRSYVVGAALAASLTLWIGFNWLPNALRETEKPASVAIALAETRTVQIAFNADQELPQAILDIRLPDGVELQGYPGQRQIRWQTDLSRGVNVLSLPLTAVSTAGGTMLARLEHGDRSTELAVQLRVSSRTHSSLSNTYEAPNAPV